MQCRATILFYQIAEPTQGTPEHVHMCARSIHNKKEGTLCFCLRDALQQIGISTGTLKSMRNHTAMHPRPVSSRISLILQVNGSPDRFPQEFHRPSKQTEPTTSIDPPKDNYEHLQHMEATISINPLKE